jgi:limonene 1,2-monooxygenase
VPRPSGAPQRRATGAFRATCFVADTTRQAREIARRNSLGKCIEYIVELTRRTAPTGVGVWKRNQQMGDAQCNLDYFMNEVVIAGDPPSVTGQLQKLRERIGAFGTLVLVAHDWDDRRQWLHSLELFTREVMPAFNRAIGC